MSTRIVCLALILASALVLTAAETRFAAPPPARAAFPGENGKIVFVGAGTGGQITTIKKDGSGMTNIANGYLPSWSADGSKIVYGAIVGGNNAEIFVMNGDGTGQVNLTNNSASDSPGSWSPDGSRIALISVMRSASLSSHQSSMTPSTAPVSATALAFAATLARNPGLCQSSRK